MDPDKECYRSTAIIAFQLGCRGRTELEGMEFDKDICYKAEDELFVVDFSKAGKRLVKSNEICKAYVRCLCGERSAAHLCLHVHLPVAKVAGFRGFHEKYLGGKTHSIRIGTLCHLMNAGVGEARIALHLRWMGLAMFLCYNRANTYRRSRYEKLVFIPAVVPSA